LKQAIKTTALLILSLLTSILYAEPRDKVTLQTLDHLALIHIPGHNKRIQITRSLSAMIEKDKKQDTNTTQIPTSRIPTWVTKPQEFNEYATTASITYDPTKQAKGQKNVALALAKQSLHRMISQKLDSVVQTLYKNTPQIYRNDLQSAKEIALLSINKDYIANLEYASSWLDIKSQKLHVFVHISLLDRLLFQQSIASTFMDAIETFDLFYYYIKNEEKYVRERISDRMNVKLDENTYSSKEAYEERIEELTDLAKNELSKYKKYYSILKKAVAKEF